MEWGPAAADQFQKNEKEMKHKELCQNEE